MNNKLSVEDWVLIGLLAFIVVIALALTIAGNENWNWWAFAGLTITCIGIGIWKILGERFKNSLKQRKST